MSAETPPDPPLLTLPDLVMSKVLKKLDMNSILTLRKVNRGLREFVDNKKPDFQIKKLSMSVRVKWICLSLYIDEKKPINIRYGTTDGDKTIVVCRKCRVVNLDMMKTCSNDLEIILKNQESISKEIGVFFEAVLLCRKSDRNQYEAQLKQKTDPFLMDLKRILGSRVHPIQTALLRMDVVDQNQVMAILPYLCSGTLREMTLRTLRYEERSLNFNVLEMDEIVKLEQWKNMERFMTDGFGLTESMSHFSHLLSFNSFMYTVKTEDLALLKEKLMSSSTPVQFKFSYRDFVDETRLVEVFGPPIADWGETTWKFSINTPGKRGKLKIIYDRGWQIIKIKRLPDVVEN